MPRYYTRGLKSASEFQARLQYLQEYCRLILVMWAMTLRNVSTPFCSKYPDVHSVKQVRIFDGHLMNDYQVRKLHDMDDDPSKTCNQIFLWMQTLIRKTNEAGGFRTCSDCTKVINATCNFKNSCDNVTKYIQNNIPLSVTQAVTIIIYMYGLTNLMGRSFNNDNTVVRIMFGYFPVFSTIRYFIHYAWMKLGQVLANPFGADVQDYNSCQNFQDHIEFVHRHFDYFCASREADFLDDLDRCRLKEVSMLV